MRTQIGIVHLAAKITLDSNLPPLYAFLFKLHGQIDRHWLGGNSYFLRWRILIFVFWEPLECLRKGSGVLHQTFYSNMFGRGVAYLVLANKNPDEYSLNLDLLCENSNRNN